jgi:hypothetical protein
MNWNVLRRKRLRYNGGIIIACVWVCWVFITKSQSVYPSVRPRLEKSHTHTHRCVSGWTRLFGMQAGLCSLYQWSKWKWIATFVTFPTVYRFVCKTERHFEVKNAKTRIMSLAGLLYVLFGSPERWSEVKWSEV